MKSKRHLVDLIRVAEDEARAVRREMKTRTTAVTPSDITEISSSIIHGLQAVAEALDHITTSSFK